MWVIASAELLELIKWTWLYVNNATCIITTCTLNLNTLPTNCQQCHTLARIVIVNLTVLILSIIIMLYLINNKQMFYLNLAVFCYFSMCILSINRSMWCNKILIWVILCHCVSIPRTSTKLSFTLQTHHGKCVHSWVSARWCLISQAPDQVLSSHTHSWQHLYM